MIGNSCKTILHKKAVLSQIRTIYVNSIPFNAIIESEAYIIRLEILQAVVLGDVQTARTPPQTFALALCVRPRTTTFSAKLIAR